MDTTQKLIVFTCFAIALAVILMIERELRAPKAPVAPAPAAPPRTYQSNYSNKYDTGTLNDIVSRDRARVQRERARIDRGETDRRMREEARQEKVRRFMDSGL